MLQSIFPSLRFVHETAVNINTVANISLLIYLYISDSIFQ